MLQKMLTRSGVAAGGLCLFILLGAGNYVAGSVRKQRCSSLFPPQSAQGNLLACPGRTVRRRVWQVEVQNAKDASDVADGKWASLLKAEKSAIRKMVADAFSDLP